jgi:rhombotail lipoprotein
MSPKRRFHGVDGRYRQLVPEIDALSDADMAKLRATPVAAREPATAGVVWIVDAGGGDLTLPESERLGLIARLADSLERAPFSTVDVLPTTSARLTSNRDDAELPILRSAAARFRHDVLIVVSTHQNRYDDWNPLAATYLAIVPRWFVPGNSLAVYASAEACALDVTSGLFLACAHGEAKAERALVTAIGRDRRMRELSTAALGAALDAIPEALRRGVHARLARQAS